MKTTIEIYCDAAINKVDDVSFSKMASIFYYQRKIIKIHIDKIKEDNNNKAELLNVVNTLNLLDDLGLNLTKNHPIVIYSDSRYAIDTMNQILVYTKKLRGIPEYYNYFKEYKKAKYEKNQKYYRFIKASKRLNKINVSNIEIVHKLMEIMDRNNIRFQWIPRDENLLVDKLTKF